MSARESIDQIKHLTPVERAQVVRFVVESEGVTLSPKFTVTTAADGMPVIRANGGVITSRLVGELESMTLRPACSTSTFSWLCCGRMTVSMPVHTWCESNREP